MRPTLKKAVSNPPITVYGVSKHYPGFLLSDVSFTIEEGDVVGLVGKNGAGKSTLIDLVLGIQPADEGIISLMGKSPQSMLPADREKIGVLADNTDLPDRLTAREQGSILSKLYRSWDEELFIELAESLNVDRGKPFLELSQGTQRKARLCFALAHNPDILILDEATSGLDPAARTILMKAIGDFLTRNSRKCALISSHISTDFVGLTNRILCIDQGKVIFDGSYDEVEDAIDKLVIEGGSHECTVGKRY